MPSIGGAPMPSIGGARYTPVTAEENLRIAGQNCDPSQAVDLGGWKLSGGIQFTFPPGTSLGAGGFLVVPKDRNQLLALARYALSPPAVLGNYQGELDNDGDTVVLENGPAISEP
jgi:hypothetical protein